MEVLTRWGAFIRDLPGTPVVAQYDATPEALAGEVAHLFTDKGARNAQIDAMNEFGRRLGEDEEAPSQRAARVLLNFIDA